MSALEPVRCYFSLTESYRSKELKMALHPQGGKYCGGNYEQKNKLDHFDILMC